MAEQVATRLSRHLPVKLDENGQQKWGDSTSEEWFDYVNTPGIYLFKLPETKWFGDRKATSMPMLIVSDEDIMAAHPSHQPQVGNYFTVVDLPGSLQQAREAGIHDSELSSWVFDEYYNTPASIEPQWGIVEDIVEGVWESSEVGGFGGDDELRVRRVIPHLEPSFICLNWATIPPAIF